MFHVLDHADVVYTGELSQVTQYVIEHYRSRLDEAIRSGIKIAYTDQTHRLNAAGQITTVADFWETDEDFELYD